MKHLILPLLSVVLLALSSSCNSRNDNRMLRDEIVSELSQIVNELNDSSFNDIVIIAEDSDDPSFSVDKSQPVSDGKGNVLMTVQIDVDDNEDTVDEYWVAIICGGLAIAGAFLTPILIGYFICYFIFRSKRDRNNLIREAIASGYQLPKEFFITQIPRERLQSAVKYIAWGIGLFLFFMILGVDAIAYLCFIPLIIGLGKLVAYFLYEHKSRKRNINNTDNSCQDNVE